MEDISNGHHSEAALNAASVEMDQFIENISDTLLNDISTE